MPCHYIQALTLLERTLHTKGFTFIHFIRNFGHLQVELLLPDRIEVAINGLGSLLGLAHLNSDIWITGSCLVLCLESLGTHDYREDGQTKT